MDPLARHAAPFDPSLWDAIDEAAVRAARPLITARRFLDVEGPFGLGLTTVEVGNDALCRQPGPDEAGAVMGVALSVPLLRRTFLLSLRRLAAAEQGQPLDLRAVEDAAEAVARREEEMIYLGQPGFHLAGLLTAAGRTRRRLGDWTDMDQALADVLGAVTALDEAGYPGPYALVASAGLYNSLFRRYEHSDMLQVEHLSRLCTLGIHKITVEGAAVIDPRAGKLVVGEDLRAGYSHQDGVHAHMHLTESIVLKLDDARAVCTLGLEEEVTVAT